MVGVHSSNLTRIISGLVSILVIHIVWDTNLREHARSHSHVLHALFSNGRQLVAETISDGCLSEFDGKWWREIFPTEDTEHINIPNAIPKCN